MHTVSQNARRSSSRVGRKTHDSRSHGVSVKAVHAGDKRCGDARVELLVWGDVGEREQGGAHPGPGGAGGRTGGGRATG